MTGRVWLPLLAVFACFLGSTGAGAQSIGPDEAIKSDGGVSQQLALTAAQRSAIYNAVTQRPGRAPAATIPAAVGAPVPHAAELSALPDVASADNSGTTLLKYVMVEDNVVVVDPLTMRVVDVIHGGVRP
jgi:hypothetical protein